MRLLIAAIGKLKQGPERDLFAHYLGRAEAAGRKLHLSPLDCDRSSRSPRAQPRQPGRRPKRKPCSPKIPSAHLTICLDPGGEALSSEVFAQALAKFRDEGTEGVAFVIGGADGLGKDRVGQGRSCAVTRSDDLAARTRANRSCRANLPRGDHPCGPPLSSRLTPPPRLRIGKRFALILPYRSVVVAIG